MVLFEVFDDADRAAFESLDDSHFLVQTLVEEHLVRLRRPYLPLGDRFTALPIEVH